MYDTDSTMLFVRVVVGGLLILVLGSGLLRRSRQNDLRRSWTEVRGEVVAEVSPIAGATYRPVIRYRTLAGETLTARRKTGWHLVTAVVGREVPVWYDPADPQRFQVQVTVMDRHGSLAFIVSALLAVVLVLVLLP